MLIGATWSIQANHDGTRYTVYGRAPSFISAVLAILLALAIHLLAARPPQTSRSETHAAPAPNGADRNLFRERPDHRTRYRSSIRVESDHGRS